MKSLTGSATVIVALALGACGGSSHPAAKDVAKHTKAYVAPSTTAPPKTVPTTSTTVKPSTKGDAVAIAKGLGCVNPKNDPSGQIKVGNIPNAVQEVSCTVSGTEFQIDVYASPADLQRVRSPAVTVVACSFAKSFGLKPPFYYVYGADFQAQAEDPTTQVGTRAQADALSNALGLPVATMNCP